MNIYQALDLKIEIIEGIVFGNTVWTYLSTDFTSADKLAKTGSDVFNGRGPGLLGIENVSDEPGH